MPARRSRGNASGGGQVTERRRWESAPMSTATRKVNLSLLCLATRRLRLQRGRCNRNATQSPAYSATHRSLRLVAGLSLLVANNKRQADKFASRLLNTSWTQESAFYCITCTRTRTQAAHRQRKLAHGAGSNERTGEPLVSLAILIQILMICCIWRPPDSLAAEETRESVV